MSLNVVPLSAGTYDTRLKAFMKAVEGEAFAAYLCTAKVPTIGWGFALNKRGQPKALSHVLNTVLGVNRPGLDLSPTAKGREEHWEQQLKQALYSSWKGKSTNDLQKKLADVLDERKEDIESKSKGYYDDADRALIGNPATAFGYSSAQQIVDTFNLIKPEYDRTIVDCFGQLVPGNCDERIAFFSMVYQGTHARRKAHLEAALKLANAKEVRAETWYLIRYVAVNVGLGSPIKRPSVKGKNSPVARKGSFPC
ncbi:MAG: hypothetical protein HY913_00635 [Desulfomonile tiedjei]|nr:hypothetical protein [Desulfomonile tiedjei]